MGEGNINVFLEVNSFPSSLELKGNESQDDVKKIVNDLLCETTKSYTGCRRLAEAKADTMDYIGCRLTEYAINRNLGYYSAKYESVGSRGDGLGYLANDTDLLSVSDKIFVCLPSTKSEPNDDTFVIDTLDCHPGYCRLKFHRRNRRIFNFPEEDKDLYVSRKGREVYVNGKAFVRLFQDGNKAFMNWTWHGPALTSEDIHQDWVLAFQCLKSDDLYKRYLKRNRQWPNSTVLEKLIQIPCSVVCAQHPNSITPELDFRFSFATAEKILFRALSHTQLSCYYMLKVLICNIDELLEGENLVRTYYLKTSFLWLCEKLHPDVWTDDNFLNCALLCLLYLQFCYSTHDLPQLFTPENNLIDHLTILECKEVVDFLNRFINPISPKSILGCFCDETFDKNFDEILSRSRRDLRRKVQELFSKTSTSSFSLYHISPLMESDTLSYISGELCVRDEHVFCQALYETIQNLKTITSDLEQCVKPILYRWLGDIVHRYPRVTRGNIRFAEECYLKGIKVIYPESGFDDQGLSGNTHLALFYYLNGDHSEAFDVLSNIEHLICDVDPVSALSVLLVADDLSRTWQDKFLTNLIEPADKYSEAIPIRYTAMALYLISKCSLILATTNKMKLRKCKIKKLFHAVQRNEKLLSSVVRDIQIINPTLQVLLMTKTFLSELMNL